MARLKVVKSGPQLFSFQLQWKQDGKLRKESLRFSTKDEAVKDLATGTYALGWAAVGDPGSSFEYTVTLDEDEVEANKGEFSNEQRAHGGAILIEVAA